MFQETFAKISQSTFPNPFYAYQHAARTLHHKTCYITWKGGEGGGSFVKEEIQVKGVALHSERTGGTNFLHIDWFTSSGGLRSR